MIMYSRIVIPLDGSDPTWAATWARRRDRPRTTRRQRVSARATAYVVMTSPEQLKHSGLDQP